MTRRSGEHKKGVREEKRRVRRRGASLESKESDELIVKGHEGGGWKRRYESYTALEVAGW